MALCALCALSEAGGEILKLTSNTILQKYIKKIINNGDENGNEMVVKFQLPSGLEIVGLPTKNFYGGHWDLGPTWNYAVMADDPFLVDSGRFGQGKNLVGMMETAGVSAKDLEFVLISHSHEDHDGGLAELVESTRLRVKAHAIYNLLIRQYPDISPWPTTLSLFAEVAEIIKPEYTDPEAVFGLQRYIKSLKKLEEIGLEYPDIFVLPAHRFY